jgi:hypothetical protein
MDDLDFFSKSHFVYPTNKSVKYTKLNETLLVNSQGMRVEPETQVTNGGSVGHTANQ